jgi:single-strand DNA-binding protein
MLDQEKVPMTNLVSSSAASPAIPKPAPPQGGTSITSISVVTDRPARKDGKTYKDENGYTAKDSEFHRITCFNGLGQNVAKYCTKGQLVTVEGRIHYTQWEDQSGTKRYGCEIIADKVDFLTKAAARATTKAPPTSTRTEPGAPQQHGPDGASHRGLFCLAGESGGAGHRTPCRRLVGLRAVTRSALIDPDRHRLAGRAGAACPVRAFPRRIRSAACRVRRGIFAQLDLFAGRVPRAVRAVV